MTIFINARFLTQPQSGVQRYAGELLSALDRKLQTDDPMRKALGPVVALHPDGITRDYGWHQIKRRRVPGGTGHLWEQGALWRASRNGILLSLGNSGPIAHPRHVLAMHDANIWDIPQAFTRRYRLLHCNLRPLLARRAAALITVSRYSAKSLGIHLGLSPRRFHIISNAANHILSVVPDRTALSQFGLRRQSYLLAVGNQSPNKNIAALVAAHEKADSAVPPLVIAGCAAPGLQSCQGRNRHRVRYLGRVSEAQLRALYEGAAGFVFPSLHEGFGIPPLEAMQLGVPVLAARRTVLPEVLGDAPLWFDPQNLPDMVHALRAFADLDATGRNHMIRRGLSRAKHYSWDASADRLIRLLCAEMQKEPGARVSALQPVAGRSVSQI